MGLRRRGYLVEYSMASGTLLATGPSLEMLKKAISEFYYGSKVTLIPLSDKEWDVSTGKGAIKKVHVIKKGKRYRFEVR